MAYGLVQLDLLAVVSGLVIVQTAKAPQFIDRMARAHEGRQPHLRRLEY